MNRMRLFFLFCVISNACFAQSEVKKGEAKEAKVEAIKGQPEVKESAEQRLQRTNRALAEDKDLYLESTIVGDKEQPTVSYFIPWKGVGTPDQLHWNIEQKNDGTLDLIDRNVLIRSMSIYNELDLEAIPVAE